MGAIKEAVTAEAHAAAKKVKDFLASIDLAFAGRQLFGTATHNLIQGFTALGQEADQIITEWEQQQQQAGAAKPRPAPATGPAAKGR